MDSNFEDLLRELEGDLEPQPPPKVKKSAVQGKSDIDDLFEELKVIEKVEPLRPLPAQRQIEPRAKTFEKCYPVVVSGGKRTGYCMSSVNMIACEKLRCTRCDLPVKRFPGKQWKPGCEYLFFRNNFSRDDKLNTMLEDSITSAAYSCQCNWRNADQPVSINGESWVCAGHYI